MTRFEFEHDHKSFDQLAFEHYLRTGQRLTSAEWELKFNPNHDPTNGRFTWAWGGGATGRRTEPARGGREVPSKTSSVKTPSVPANSQNRVTNAAATTPQRERPAGLSESVISAAQAAHRDFGVPASVTIAQFALESGWGKHMPPNSNNPFGIKARPGEPFVETGTWEEDRQGRRIVIKAKFRKFTSLDEAFAAHARLLQSPAYARAQAAKSSADYADALTGVYATDHQYGSKLKSIMNRHGLDSYDKRR